MELKKLLITGGHPTPAMAFIDYVKSSGRPVDIVFLGRRYANERENNDTFEYQEVWQSRRISFTNSIAKRGLVGVLNVIPSIMQAIELLQKEKPSAILSFGGYISVPACIVSVIFNIPFFIHEQTARPGMANRFMSLFAKKIFVSFPETAKDFLVFPWQKSKLLYTGNPIRSEVYAKNTEVPKFLIGISGPLVFVNGGNLGSHAVNEHIFKIIPELLKVANIVHQIGNIREYGDWECAISKEQMNKVGQHRYIPIQFIPTVEVFNVIKRANCIVSRCGANTFFELVACQKPCVLVPLPYSSRGEQEFHASILKKAGVAEIFSQYGDSDELLRKVLTILQSGPGRVKMFGSLSSYLSPESASNIYDHLTDTLNTCS